MFWQQAREHRAMERVRKTFARCASSFEEEARTAAFMGREQMSKHGFRFEDLTGDQTAPETEILEKNFHRAQEFWRQQDERDKAQVLDAIGTDPIHIDKLAEKVGMEIAKLSGILLQIELIGEIVQRPGKFFHRKTESPEGERRPASGTESPRTGRQERTQDARDATNEKTLVSSYVRADGRRVRGYWRARRGEAKAKPSWKYDPDANPGPEWSWIRSYVRSGNIEVRGHWRKRPKPAQPGA